MDNEKTETKPDNEQTEKPYGNVDYADPGYQPDGKSRYPLDTREHVMAAARYFGVGANRDRYTSTQRRHIDAAINAAKRKFGIDPASYRDHLDNT